MARREPQKNKQLICQKNQLTVQTTHLVTTQNSIITGGISQSHPAMSYPQHSFQSLLQHRPTVIVCQLHLLTKNPQKSSNYPTFKVLKINEIRHGGIPQQSRCHSAPVVKSHSSGQSQPDQNLKGVPHSPQKY